MAATAGRTAGVWATEHDARERLRDRLGAPAPARPKFTVSVVVCTHRRLANLSRLLTSLARLDPPPDELIVVDNDPGRHSAEAAALVAGARYVREPRRGLNVARATGLRSASGDLVAFIDDDCIAPPGWLRDLPRHFADPTVGGVTGPLFAHELGTAPQAMRERITSFNKGHREHRFDWTWIWAVHSGRVGAGANMIFRRRTLLGIEDAFPPELDGGTPTRSGGDLYALYKLIAGGHRIVYEPSAYLFHRHAETPEALHSTLDGYGTGLSAFLTRALIVDREPATVAIWRWLWRIWLRLALDSAFGSGDADGARCRGRYLLGGLKGPLAWVRARRRANVPDPREAAEPATVDVHPREGGAQRVEIIAAATTLEANRAARAADGDVLVFLSDDHEFDSALGNGHEALHSNDGKPRLVVGRTVPDAEPASLTALAGRLRIEDDQRLAREAAAPTFADVTECNVSLRRDAFIRLGGLAPGLDLRTGLRDLALRALQSGFELVQAPDATATRLLAEDLPTWLDQAKSAGHGDRLLAERHPAASAALPARPRISGPVPGRAAAAAITLLRSRGARRAVVPALNGLERLRLRRIWFGLARLAVRGAYEEGLGPVRRAVNRREPPGAIRIDLDTAEPIPPPVAVAPAVRLVARGEVVAEARAPGGHWHHEFLEDFVAPGPTDRGRHFPTLPVAATAADGRGAIAPAPTEGSERPLEGVEVIAVALPSSDRHALAAAGATVTTIADARAAGHWGAVASAVASGDDELVAFALPGVSFDPAAVAAVLPAFDAKAIAAAFVAGVEERQPPSPLVFRFPKRSRLAYARPRLPAQLLVVRRSACRGLIDSGLTTLGEHAPVLDLFERLLAGGRAVVYAEVPGIEPALVEIRHGRRTRFAAGVARAALVCRDAARIGGLGGAWYFTTNGPVPRVRILWRVLTGRGSLASWVAGNVAFAYGCARAARRLRSLPVNDHDPPAVARPSPIPARAAREARAAGFRAISRGQPAGLGRPSKHRHPLNERLS